MGRVHITHDRDAKGIYKFSREHKTKNNRVVFITGGGKIIIS